MLTDTLGLTDLRDNYASTSRGEIRKAIKVYSTRTTKTEVEASRKVGDRATEDPEDRNYLNFKRSFNNLSCRFCDEEMEESQEHLEECSGCDYERRTLRMTNWKGKVIFWRRMTAKIDKWGKGDS